MTKHCRRFPTHVLSVVSVAQLVALHVTRRVAITLSKQNSRDRRTSGYHLRHVATGSLFPSSFFKQVLKSYHESWLPARDVVIKALAERYEVDPSGEILVFDSACPWKAHLFELENGASRLMSP